MATKFDRASVTKHGTAIEELIQKYCNKNNLNYLGRKGSFNSEEVRFTFTMAPAGIKFDADNDDIRCGFAPIGMEVAVRWSDGQTYEGIIFKNAGHGYYGIRFDDGGQWKVSWEKCSRIK